MATVKLEIKAGELSKEQKKSIRSITDYLTKFFAKESKRIAKAIGKAYAKATKAADDSETEADQILEAASLDEWDVVASDIADDLGGSFEQTAQIVLGKLDISDQDVFDLVNQKAVDYADESGAELVTGISDTTRERLRSLITDALENAQSVDDLQSAIEDSTAFSSDRAETIARTEIGNAHMSGALEGAKQSGLDMKKAIIRGSEEFDCDICGDNEDAGDIELDALFPSGDEAPLFHPNCECTLVFHIAKDEE